MIDIGIGPNLVSVDAVFSWVVSWHGFFSFVAVASSVLLVGRWAALGGVKSDDIYSIAVWAIIGGVIGARLVHVVDNWTDIYQHRPVQVFYIASGGIGLWGGILGGFLGGALYSFIAKYPIGVIADLTAPALLYAQTIGRVGDIINGEHCAKAADFFLSFMWTHPNSPARLCANQEVHPVIIYEMGWNMIVLALLWQLRGRLKPDGMLFALYLAFYSVGRFGISFLREDRVWALGMQEAHYIALLVLAITVPLMALRMRFRQRLDVAPAMAVRGSRAQRRRRSRGS